MSCLRSRDDVRGGDPVTQRQETRGKRQKNKAGYTAQDAPSMRTFHLRK